MWLHKIRWRAWHAAHLAAFALGVGACGIAALLCWLMISYPHRVILEPGAVVHLLCLVVLGWMGVVACPKIRQRAIAAQHMHRSAASLAQHLRGVPRPQHAAATALFWRTHQRDLHAALAGADGPPRLISLRASTRTVWSGLLTWQRDLFVFMCLCSLFFGVVFLICKSFFVFVVGCLFVGVSCLMACFLCADIYRLIEARQSEVERHTSSLRHLATISQLAGGLSLADELPDELRGALSNDAGQGGGLERVSNG